MMNRQLAKVTYPLLDVLFMMLCAGIPVDDIIARIIVRVIDLGQFRHCFINWMTSLHKLTKGDLVAIDGKTLRSSYNRADRRSTLHMVNAYACANKLVIGQNKTDEKSNEIIQPS